MANKEQLDSAREIFISQPEIKVLYMNNRGEFFTQSDYAKNSTTEGKRIETIHRKSVIKDKENE